ncbi:alpha/beta fold hydrolase [Thaumasiovibrio sp. DFM-14]|uniref:alpha/beta fold hydrolase n=1 Tax=Thaumasiovibrio sp. DFM-14 TaxID=3384792 RepID=UPI0039A38B90
MGKHNLPLYWMSFTHHKAQGVVVVLNGRVETCWKYQEICYDLFQQGYDVYTFDHRGQGHSPRLSEKADLGHIDCFDYFVDDAHTFLRTIVKPARYQHSHLLAHSMGGTIATLLLTQHAFTSAALCAPMYGIALSPIMKRIARPCLQLLDWWKGEPGFAPKQGPYINKPFENNVLTHSETRYRWFRQLYQSHPQLRLGGASRQWVIQATKAAQQCRKIKPPLGTPLLILQADKEAIVDNEIQIQVAKQLDAKLTAVANAKHEILFESDPIRTAALNEIFAFFKKAEQSND